MGEEIRAKRAKDGKDGIYRFDYRYANRAFKNITDAIRAGNMHSVWTNHSRPVYNSKGEPTKRREYYGNNALPNWVDVHMSLQYEEPEKNKNGELLDDEDEGYFFAVIEKCRIDRRLRGLEIEDPTFDRVHEVLMGARRKRGIR